MVARDTRKKTTPRKPNVKSARSIQSRFAAALLFSLGVSLAAGCLSSSPSQKVYDRYAELVASRNQPGKSPAAGAAASAAAKLAAKPAETTVTAAKPAAVPVPAPNAPRAATPVPAPTAKPAPAAPTPAPAAPAPVQVIMPAGPEKPPVLPAETPVPAPAAPAAPAPVAVPAAAGPVPASVPAPAPAAPAASPAATPAVENATENGYVLKVGDGVQIYLRGIPTPEVIEDVIDEGGKVTLPYINEVQAAGMAVADLERAIRQIYLDQDIYRNITVNVVVPTRYYFILGEVRAAGRFQIMSATRVSQAIAAAGGYTEYASGRVQIKRGGKIVKDIRNARRLERTPEDDILLEPDDVIEVLRSWI